MLDRMKRRISLLAAITLTISIFSLNVVGAEADKTSDAVASAGTTKSYTSYIAQYETAGSVDHTVVDHTVVDQMVNVDLGNMVNSESVTIQNEFQGKTGNIAITAESGSAEWTFEIPQDGLYAIQVEYYPMKGTVSAVQRTLRIDGSVPFDEANCVEFGRVFVSDGQITTKSNGNDIRPTQIEAPQWLHTYIKDSYGYFGSKLQILFHGGNT